MTETPKPRILFVDDEPDLLAGLVRNLRSEHFEVTTASSGGAAVDLLSSAGPFAVIVSDLRMPQMDGVTLLRKAHDLAPETIRILFTGQPDVERSIAAVNEGAIFRFLTKPCSRVTLASTLRAAIDQHRLITAERVLLEQTLHGSVKALTGILSLTAPMAFGRATRLRQMVRSLAAACGAPESWPVEVAAMLSQVGSVILPPLVSEKLYQGEPLSPAEEAMVRRMPAVVEQVLANIPRLEPVREILGLLDCHFDGAEPTSGSSGGAPIPWGARALKVALDLDILESSGVAIASALERLRERQGSYDPEILAKLTEIRSSEQSAHVREIPLAGLLPGMMLAEDVRTADGNLFIARGQEVSASLLERLRNFGAAINLEEACRIRADSAGAPAAPEPSGPSPESPDADPATGLPGKTQAESVLRSLLESEEPCHVVVLVLDTLPSLTARFGRRAADEMLHAFGRYIAPMLTEQDRLFRWSGPALVALRTGVNDVDAVGNYFRIRLEHHNFQHLVRTSTHSIPISAPPHWAVLPAMEPVESVARKVDKLIEALVKQDGPPE